MAATDNKSSLQHILADGPPSEEPRVDPSPAPSARQAIASSVEDQDDDNNKDPDTPQYSSLTQTTRRNANGSVSSVFSGNKIRHLKKEDGVPLWRKDIQFEFLQAIFEDRHEVFTRLSDKSKGHTFTEVYIDTLASSSKTSKILKEKLQQDQSSALTMAMVCLLVNIGRMNTTLNFFPEMRAQLRTYHSIPALQAHQDPHAYKQLQDAPRLKSILKGASEDEPQPGTMEEVKAAQRPRTNAVNLIFVLAQYAPKVSEMHFTPPRDFFDLIMRTTLSSKSRARALLWLLWWYLESDFSREDALNNPFGPGEDGEGTEGLPVKVPALENLTEEQAALENVDTPHEVAFGEAKRRERIAVVASEPSAAMTALKRARKERGGIYRSGYVPSDGEGALTPSRELESPVPHGSAHSGGRYDYGSDAGSPSPPGSSMSNVRTASKAAGGQSVTHEETPSRSVPVKPKGPGRGNWRRNKFATTTTSHAERATAKRSTSSLQASPGGASILPATILNELMSKGAAAGGAEGGAGGHQNSKKGRPLTTHQLAISDYKATRIRRILERGTQQTQVEARKRRLHEGPMLRAWKRIKTLGSGWDSDEEEARASSDKKDEENKSSLEVEGDGKLFGRQLGKKDGPIGKPAGGVWMAGFILPGLKEVEDCGEEFGHYARVAGFARERFEKADGEKADGEKADGEKADGAEPHSVETFKETRFGRRKSVVDVYAEELQREVELGDRPRLVRKSIGATRGGRGSKRSKGSDATGRGASKTEDGGKGADGDVADTVEGDGEGEGEMIDGDEDEMDVDGGLEAEGDQGGTVGGGGQAGQAELDEEDRELLGEVDADESEDNEDEDEEEDDEDEEEDDGDGDGDGDGDADVTMEQG